MDHHCDLKNDSERYVCDTCQSHYTSKSSFIRHLRIHKQLSPKPQLTSNLPIHDVENSKCNAKFPHRKSLAGRLGTQTGEKPRCDVCKKQFANSSNLKRHLHVHSKKKPFVCDICHKKFTRKNDLNQHMSDHPGKNKGKNPFGPRCDLCNKKFSDKVSLKRHLRRYTGERPYECDICYEKFVLKVYLNQHMNIHSSENQFGCDKCKKSNDQHGPDGTCEFVCKKCNRQFSRWGFLSTHRRFCIGGNGKPVSGD